MEKIKENKEIVIVLVIILGVIFYWFQIRPTMIKKNCSWVTETLPADPGVTQEQAEINKKIYDSCIASDWKCDPKKELQSKGVILSPEVYIGRISLKTDTKPRPPQPERKEKTEASEKEYNICLRQHGL